MPELNERCDTGYYRQTYTIDDSCPYAERQTVGGILIVSRMHALFTFPDVYVSVPVSESWDHFGIEMSLVRLAVLNQYADCLLHGCNLEWKQCQD